MGNHILLERIELNNTVGSITFANIPQTGYTDLVIKGSARGSSANIGRAVNVTFNSSGSNKRSKALYAENSVTGASNYTNQIWFIDGTNAASASANTFSSFEIYVPNYNSSVNKSLSIDTVTENNGVATLGMSAGLWTDVSAISSITIAAEAGSFVANSTFSLYGVASLGTTPAIAPKATGGNVISTDGTYWYHAFLSSGTFTPLSSITSSVLVIAGGGGGGGSTGGGGGAGGVCYQATRSLSTSSITVTVGAGGTYGVAGSNSVFDTITALGGGLGLGEGGITGSVANGGSGGGGGRGTTNGSGSQPAGSATQSTSGGATGYGNNGGTGSNNGNYVQSGGGGGGAGAAGANASSNVGGNGGAGLNTWSTWASATGTGVSGYYAGGGGGSVIGYNSAGTVGTGGAGGGGTGTNSNGNNTAKTPNPGTTNTGSGGSGGGNQENGGSGGSGIVIIRYAV